MKGSNKRKSFVEPVGTNSSNFKNETSQLSLMKEEQHHNNIYVRASIHLLTTLSTLALIAVKMSYIEIQPTFSYLSPNIAQWLERLTGGSAGCGFEPRLGLYFFE